MDPHADLDSGLANDNLVKSPRSTHPEKPTNDQTGREADRDEQEGRESRHDSTGDDLRPPPG